MIYTTQKILKEYETMSPLYSDFCVAITRLIESILKDEPFRYRLSYRVKEAESLEEKIDRKKGKGKVYKSITDIDDIAGVRVVFHNKKDRERLIEKLKKEFGGKLELEETSKVSGYRAVHAVVSFSESRLRLGEYARFRGLKCEIQLTLILDHAWAEVEHDILYKQDSKIGAINKKEYITLKKRMENVMAVYIKKGTDELEDISRQIKKLKAASS